jgi:fructose-1,6-bisphosphatase/inositol monophosphatase family enzyme
MKQQIKNLEMFMKLAVEGGITIIQGEAAAYESKPKVHYDGKEGDLVTSADLKAQAHYQNQVMKHFPEFPVVGEEDQIQKTISGKRFTCDPLDGTKAFDRKQSTGTATMFAFTDDDTVPAVCIGDTNTREIYQYAPDLSPVRTRFGFTTFLSTEWPKPHSSNA